MDWKETTIGDGIDLLFDDHDSFETSSGRTNRIIRFENSILDTRERNRIDTKYGNFRKREIFDDQCDRYGFPSLLRFLTTVLFASSPFQNHSDRDRRCSRMRLDRKYLYSSRVVDVSKRFTGSVDLWTDIHSFEMALYRWRFIGAVDLAENRVSRRRRRRSRSIEETIIKREDEKESKEKVAVAM